MGLAGGRGSQSEASAPSRGGFSGISAPDTYAGKPQKWGDYLTSREFVVPLLSGLGKMAGSNSRYLGSAVLQGIGGAAESYQNLENQLSERDIKRGELGVKQQESNLKMMEFYKNNFIRYLDENNQVRYRSLIDPTKTYSESEYAAVMGNITNRVMAGQNPQQAVQQASYNPAQVGVRQAEEKLTGKPRTPDTAGKPGAEQAGKPAPQSPAVSQLHSTFADTDNPDILTAKADSLRQRALIMVSQGIAGPEAKLISDMESQAKVYEDRADKIKRGEILPFKRDKSGQDSTYFDAARERDLKAEEAKERAKGVVKSVDDFRKEIGEAQRGYDRENLVVRAVDLIYQDLSGDLLGPGSDRAAAIYDSLMSIPGMKNFLPKSAKDFIGAYSTAQKETLTEALAAIRDMDAQRAPASTLKITPQIVASPNLPAAARYNIMTDLKAEMEKKRQFYSDWLAAGQPEPTSFRDKWEKDPKHSTDIYKDNAMRTTKYYEGMTTEEKRLHSPKTPSYTPEEIQGAKQFIADNPNDPRALEIKKRLGVQ
jgi:hypothetical protein